MGQIAKLTQVNHSLIFHHFENKEKLWLAVKQNIVKEKVQAFKHYQQCGEVNPQLKPEFILMFVLSIVNIAASDQTVFTQTPADEEACILFCVERLQRALS